MIPLYFLLRQLRLRFFKSIGTLYFGINYLIISLLEEKKAFLFQLFQLFQLIFQHIPPTPIFIYIYIYYIYN